MFHANENTTTEAVDAPTFCYIHPTVETTLRCNKCGQYICSRCAVRTPVGYRCTRCVRQQQDVFYSATPVDYAVTAAVGAVAGGAAGFVLSHVLFLALFLGVPAGGIIAEIAFRLTKRRRGRYSAHFIAGGIVLGTLIANYQLIQLWIAAPEALSLLSLVGPLLYVVLCAGAAAARLRFGR